MTNLVSCPTDAFTRTGVILGHQQGGVSDNMISALSSGPKHHFFGYYGVDFWDPSQRCYLALETDFDDHRPEPEDVAAVGLIDRESGLFSPLAETSAFNLQQGSMMHWIDAGFGAEFTYNDWADGELVSRPLNPETGQARTIQGAVAVSPTEPIGIGLNIAGMSSCRAVVGYANTIDPASWEQCPEDDGLFLLDFREGSSRLLLSIADGERNYQPFGDDILPHDGHNSFSPDGLWIVCDTFLKTGSRLTEPILYNIQEKRRILLGEFLRAPQYKNDIRCDLHPGWSRHGTTVSFDSFHGDTRQICLTEVSEIV